MVKFYGIGIGPGDKNLLTLAAVEALGKADVVFCPRAKDKQKSLALTIAKNYIRKEAEIIEQTFLMTKDRDKLGKVWDKAVKIIKKKLDENKNTAFITLGDPSLYSTYSYVLNRIKDIPDVEIATIPGIPAFLACAATLNLPLVTKDEKLALIPATDISSLDKAIKLFDTIVLYKLGKNLKKVIEYLSRQNLLDKSYMVSRVSAENQHAKKQLKNFELSRKEAGYMSTIIIKRNNS